MSRISLQMYTVRDFTRTEQELAKTVERLAGIGLKNLQYSLPDSFDIDNVTAIFKQNGISIDSPYCALAEIESKIPRIDRILKLFPSPYLRINSIPDAQMNCREGYVQYAAELNRLGGIVKKQLGIKLLYHFHAFEFINFEDCNGMDILLNQTDKELVAFQPDTFWMQTGGKEPSAFLRRIADRVSYVHTKDYRIGPRTGVLESYNAFFAEVGKGNLHWDSIIAVCKGIGVRMYVIEQDNCYGKNPFDCVKTSFENLKRLGVD